MAQTTSQTNVDLLIAPRYSENQVWSDEEISQVISLFLSKQTFFARRNEELRTRHDFYEGRHWDPLDDDDDQDQYRLVLNYARRIVLGRVASLAKAPRPRIRVDSLPSSEEAVSANAREKLLLSLWPDLLKAWRKVEMNATKLSYGVFQAIWEQPKGMRGPLAGGQTERKITDNPFRFRSIPPNLFYPVYRTYDDPNDFMGVFRFDPKRLVADLEEQYGIAVQQMALSAVEAEWGLSWEPIGLEGVADVIEYHTKSRYLLICRSRVNTVAARGHGDGRTNIQQFEPYIVLAEADNKEGVIPFWLVPNLDSNPNANPSMDGSISDMDDIIFINQHMNHIVSEEADEIVTNIHRPIVYKSSDHVQDPNELSMEAGAVYPIDIEEELDHLKAPDEVPATDRHLVRLKEVIQDLSFMGEAGFGRSNENVSGVAARIALTPQSELLELKIPLRQDALKLICKYIFKVLESNMGNSKFKAWFQNEKGQFAVTDVSASDIGGRHWVDIIYGNLVPRDEHADDQNEVYRHKSGTQSLSTTIDRMGHADPEAEINRIKMEAEDPILNPDIVTATAQAKMAEQQAKVSNPSLPPPGTESAPTGNEQPGATPNSPQFSGQANLGPSQAAGVPGRDQTRPLQAGPSNQAAASVPSGPAFPNSQALAAGGAGTNNPAVLQPGQNPGINKGISR